MNLSREGIERAIQELKDEKSICEEDIYNKQRELDEIEEDLFKLEGKLKNFSKRSKKC